ncbi:discoidin domain-containing protein [Pelosinus sp. IPA-1]|uniref:discoidin domain-containing protein n=1 Tax=Pelosinus sp. IPA-1 TaxID=3029569 RepID=UPI0024361A46|nr:discoidin domain-containing protein [Pelosinus sp. IPA-1]GMB01083.1 hypothetical protein PIPA1_38820 [Pelosinus sp. IPA-1]
MSGYTGMILTTAGLNLQAQAQLGGELIITKICVGDGLLADGESYDSLTALKKQIMSLGIQDMAVTGDGQSRIRALMTNDSITTGFFVREVGVFAKIGAEGTETLYSYTNAGDKADYLPSKGINVVEEVLEVYIIVGNAQNVTCTINDRVTLATKQDLHDHTANTNNPHNVIASQIANTLISGLGTTDIQSTLAAIYSEATKKDNSLRNVVITGPIDSNGNAAALSSDLTASPIKIKAGTVINFANGFNGVNPVDIPYNVLADASLTLPAADANTIPLQYTADLCNGGTPISDSDYSAGYVKAYAFDNIGSTSWSSLKAASNQSGQSFIGYGFGVNKAIRKIYFAQNTLSTKWMPLVKAQYSDDNVTWNDAVTTSALSMAAIATFTVPYVGAHKYWRVLAMANLANGITWEAAEVEMYEALQIHYIYATRATDGTVTYGATKQKLKTGKQYGSQITAGVLAADDYVYSENRCVGGSFGVTSTYSTNLAQYAFDGNPSTFWESNNPGGSGDALVYDFGVARHIRRLVLDHTMGDGLHFMSSVKVQRCTDGVTWIDVYTATGLTSGLNTIILPASTPSRYWRVLANAQTSGGAAALWCVTELTMHEICTDLTVYDPYQGISRYFDGTTWTNVVRNFLGEAVVDSSGKIVSYTTYDYNKAKLKALPAEDSDDVVTLGQFTRISDSNGNMCIKFPDGTMIQMGTGPYIDIGAVGGIDYTYQNISFPFSFSECFNVIVGMGTNTTTRASVAMQGVPWATGFQALWMEWNNTTAQSICCRYIAIGRWK